MHNSLELRDGFHNRIARIAPQSVEPSSDGFVNAFGEAGPKDVVTLFEQALNSVVCSF